MSVFRSAEKSSKIISRRGPICVNSKKNNSENSDLFVVENFQKNPKKGNHRELKKAREQRTMQQSQKKISQNISTKKKSFPKSNEIFPAKDFFPIFFFLNVHPWRSSSRKWAKTRAWNLPKKETIDCLSTQKKSLSVFLLAFLFSFLYFLSLCALLFRSVKHCLDKGKKESKKTIRAFFQSLLCLVSFSYVMLRSENDVFRTGFNKQFRPSLGE